VDIIQSMRLSRMRIMLIAVVLAVAGLLVSASQIAPAGAATAAAGGGGPKPAIVLEHGAWADGSSWDGVIGLLQADGYTVYAPPNPLRGLANDSATLSDFLKTITGPVILVGHSYGVTEEHLLPYSREDRNITACKGARHAAGNRQARRGSLHREAEARPGGQAHRRDGRL
jgi:pimeloyl-ACP methyl ester carboxylesterase